VRLAITLNLQAYGLRLQEAPPKTGLLAGFEQNLGYCYDTANEHATALLWFEKARARWVEQGKEWPPMTKMNMARCLVYLGRYKEADELLDGAIGEFKAAAEERVNWAMLA
jgi:tetratricopeptide (TPR) repeat protein